MERLSSILSVIDIMLNTKRNKHIIGGVLLSTSLLFGGLAFTVMIVKTEDGG